MPEIEEQKTITLRKPVTLGEVTYDKLELREPTAGEMSIAQKAGGGVDLTMSLIQQIARMPKKAVESLGARDLTEADAYLAGFMASGQANG